MSANVADRDRQIATLQREIATLQRQIATLQRETTQESSASAKEEITQLKTEISDLKTENAEWRGKFEKLDSVRRELERQASTVADCGHQPELHSLREQLHSLECLR